MEIKIKETKNNTAFLNVVLTETEVLAEKEHAVDELISTVTVKGFRQGKAPKSIAANHIDPDKLSNHILSHVLNNVVVQAIKENNFKLLGKPVLENIDSKDNNGWTIKLSFPLYPEINLNNYKKFFTKKDTANKKTKEAKSETNEAKIDKIYDILLKNINIDIPQSVVEEELNYSMERLENQAKSLNLSLENYLKAVKKTNDEVKEEYSKKAAESIKLDLILLEIAKTEKIETSNEEIQAIAKAGAVPENQYGQLKSVIDRRKTIEYLLKLC